MIKTTRGQEAELLFGIRIYNIGFVNRRKLLLENTGKTHRQAEIDQIGKWQEIQLEL